MYAQITGLIRTLLLTIESLGVATTHEGILRRWSSA
jgi:hypothetical protein